MLIVTIIFQLIIASNASPYFKYPFVFLLDVGNEELSNTSTEQIRVSIPGGSLAVRYPAVSDGDLITHVRVSSIDFGSDLKASILDGGPGYKYVVLVLLGNTGVTCDAVITIKTLPYQVSSNIDSKSSSDSVNTISDDTANNSLEEMSIESKKTVNKNTDLAQQSSNVNNYAQLSNDDEENDDSNEIKDELDGDEEDNHGKDSSEEGEEIVEEQDASFEVNSQSDEDDDKEYRAESLQDGYRSKYDSNEFKSKSRRIESNQDGIYKKGSIYDTRGNAGDDLDLDQIFNDEEIHDDSDKLKDSNNNNFNSEYESSAA